MLLRIVTILVLLCDIVDGWHVRFAYLLCHVSLLVIAFAFAAVGPLQAK